VKPLNSANNNLIDRMRQLWQPRLGCDLSREDARQIAANVTGFFSLLAEWSRAEMPSPENDTGRRSMTAEAIAKALDGRKTGGAWIGVLPGS
jgi:hypothetical protein